jgi:hypothetical protein
MWFTGINYYKLAVEKDRDSIFTTITSYGNQLAQEQLTKIARDWKLSCNLRLVSSRLK